MCSKTMSSVLVLWGFWCCLYTKKGVYKVIVVMIVSGIQKGQNNWQIIS